jgi:hypothetical protein
MRTEAFHEEHDVELSEDERALRGRQAARQAVAIRAHKQKAEDETEAWAARKKALKADEEMMVAALYKTSDAAEKGREPRQVECREELVGAMVITIRCDTDETVSSRPATEDELRGAERERQAQAKAKPLTPEERAKKLRQEIARLDTKPHATKWVEGKLTKACPEATSAEVKGEIDAALANKRLTEDADGKLRRAEADDGIVADDDYTPEMH